jgi:alginate O-acetyltransferase complex protein AlgI
MAFTTPTYLLFLALTFALYWASKKRAAQNLLLVVTSYLFYATWDSRFGALLLGTSLLDYSVGISLAGTKRQGARRALLMLSLCGNLCALALFKYFNFFAENFYLLAQAVGWRTDPLLVKILLPVGISFYTLKSLGYTVDVYHRRTKATTDLIAYLAYVAFFPQLLAGPIDRAGNLLRQLLEGRRFVYAMAVDGCRQILWGLFKKMLLADNLAPIVQLGYGQAAVRPGPQLMLATIFFAFQIYCDFSAYSDIAIGSAKLLGIESLPNFAYPYFSQSPAEFWRRWHISLTTWFRDYVYFSMGGVRGTASRRAFNVIGTFLLSGLWHGASWNFLIWGGINGAAVLPAMLRRSPGRLQEEKGEQQQQRHGLLPSLQALLKMLLTFSFICLAWVFFRAQTLSDAVLIIKKIFVDALNPAAYRGITALLYPYADYPLAGKKIILFLSAFVLIEWIQRQRPHPLMLDDWPGAARWLVYNGLIFLVLYFGTHFVTGFYYYQF